MFTSIQLRSDCQAMEVSSGAICRPAQMTFFDSRAFCYLLEILGDFFIRHCSWERRRDKCRFHIVNKPECKPEFKGTVKEKMVVLTWSADDMYEAASLQHRETGLLPPRDHEQLLRNAFCEFDLEVDQRRTGWVVRISVPEKTFEEIHVFRDQRESTSFPPLPPPESTEEEDEKEEGKK